MSAEEGSEGALTLASAAMPFPERLAAIRKERHMTQQALADQAKLNVSMIRKYETGAGEPNLQALRRLALALSISADRLVFEEGDFVVPDTDARRRLDTIQSLEPSQRAALDEMVEGMVVKNAVARAVNRKAKD